MQNKTKGNSLIQLKSSFDEVKTGFNFDNYAQVTFNRQNMIKLYILYPKSVHLLFSPFSYTFSVNLLAFFAYISLLRPDTCLLPQTDPGLIQNCLYSFKGDAYLMFQSAMNN